MQLIQIGETKQKTVLDMVQEMAARQLAEIDQLKLAASTRQPGRATRRTRSRCESSKIQRTFVM
jgi:hypothetical protein